MRGVAKLAIGLGLALAVAGCDPVTDRKYVREGIGVDLNSSHLPEATDRLEQYTDHICQQAGYTSTGAKGRFSSCFANGGWTAFVQAGMNDIDQRCDAYLSWLDAKRRDREPVLRQLATTSAVVHSIMTVSGAGTDSLDIVSNAFGLAAAGYSNWNSRLLLEVNQSTVQTVVYSRQKQFRDEIKNELVADRPRAIYLLRNYVRICLPITIETDINTAITLVQRGSPMAAKDNPVVSVAGLGRPLSSDERAGQRPRRPPRPNEAYKDIVEGWIPTVSTITNIQKAICVPKAEWGVVGVTTPALIEIWERTDLENGTVNRKLDERERKILSNTAECPTGSGVKNFYEWQTFVNATGVRRSAEFLIRLLNNAPDDQNPDERTRLKDGGQLDPKASLEQARARIAQVRRDVLKDKLHVSLPSSMSDQVTDDLIAALRALPARPAAPAGSPAQPVNPAGGG